MDSGLANYRIIHEIGVGGMAVVYKAVQKSLDRTVAIKELTLSDRSSDPSLTERFRREARAAAALHHPNITTIHDFWEKDNRAYIVMEYVDGPELKNLMESMGEIDPFTSALIAIEICKALSYAHNKGMIHRDIKPGNVMLSVQGDVKLTDFGIVYLAGASDLTQPGHMLGTPAYMSPEQIEGGKIGPASDIFSLGVLLYEMVSGDKPFDEDNPIALSHAILHKDPLAPHERSDLVPGNLSEVIIKCMAKDPSDRLISMDELEGTLAELLPSLSPAPTEAVITLLKAWDEYPKKVATMTQDISPDDGETRLASAGETTSEINDDADKLSEIVELDLETASSEDMPADTVDEMARELGLDMEHASAVDPDPGDEPAGLEIPPLPDGSEPGEPEYTGHKENVDARKDKTPDYAALDEPNLELKPLEVKSEDDSTDSSSPRDKTSGFLIKAIIIVILTGAVGAAVKFLGTPANIDQVKSSVKELTARPTTAHLSITVTPWAKVTLDDTSKGRHEGNFDLTITPGPHILTLSHPEHGERRIILQIEPGESRVLSVDFTSGN